MGRYGSTGSGELDTSQLLSSSPAFLTSLVVYTDGVNDTDVIIYDHASSSTGRIAGKITTPGGQDYGGKNWPANAPNRCSNGIYVVVSGTGGSCIVEYQPCG